jgi:alkylation response protein AidB-like acyl-CoA dehydrogenase
MWDTHLSEDEIMIRNLAREIAKESVVPVREKYDREGIFPWDIVKILAEADLFRALVPKEYDGLDFSGSLGPDNPVQVSTMLMCLVTEELSRACAGIALAYAGTALGLTPILLFGSDEQKKRLLPSVAAGEKLCAFALTEPNAGSDAGSIATTAKRNGDYYILNGTKQWITNGGEAKIYSVITSTDRSRGARGLSAFIVEDGMEGFSYGKKEDKMGIRASATRELVFDNCKVPAKNLLGKEGRGFIVTMNTFDITRPGVAAQAVGIAQGALDEAVKYAKQREQFGQHIAGFQGIQFMLADMATMVEASRALTYYCSRAIDAGAPGTSGYSSMAKLLASDTAVRVTTDALQIFGGYGYMREYPMEKMMRDAKITQIYEGTNQIQRQVIALELIKKGGKW